MNDERMQILKMIEEKKITAEEGAKLLSAVEPPGREEARDVRNSRGRWFRVRVTDMKTGKRKVNVNIPLGLVEVGAKLGVRFGARNDPELSRLDFNEIISMIRSGAEGKIVDVEDEEDNERVEVYVE